MKKLTIQISETESITIERNKTYYLNYTPIITTRRDRVTRNPTEQIKENYSGYYVFISGTKNLYFFSNDLGKDLTIDIRLIENGKVKIEPLTNKQNH